MIKFIHIIFALAVCLLASAVQHILCGRACGLDAYVRTALACGSDLKRQIIYKQSSTTCNGPATIDLGEKEDCSALICALNEYQPVLSSDSGQCVEGSIIVDRFAVPSKPRCPAVPIKGSVSCACTVSDILHAISQCKNGTRSYVPYYTKDCDHVTATAAQLGPSSIGPCDAASACHPGFQATSGLCSACPQGTYSSSLQRYDFFERMPNEFVDACYEFSQSLMATCAEAGHSGIGWRPSADGTYLTTGANLQGINNVEIMFTIHLDIMHLPAAFGFKYRLSTETGSDYFGILSSTQPHEPIFLDSGDKGDSWIPFVHRFHADTEIPADELCAWSLGVYDDDVWVPILGSTGGNRSQGGGAAVGDAAQRRTSPIASTCVTVNQLWPFDPESFWPAEPAGTSPSAPRTQREVTLLPIFSPLTCAIPDEFTNHYGLAAAKQDAKVADIVFVLTANDSIAIGCIRDYAQRALDAGAHGILFVIAGEDTQLGFAGANGGTTRNVNRYLSDNVIQYPRKLRIGTISDTHHELFLRSLYGVGYATEKNVPYRRRYGSRRATLTWNREPGYRVELIFIVQKDGSLGSNGPRDFVDVKDIWFDVAAPVCVPAAPGYYVSERGATQPSQCQKGFYTPSSGHTGCLRCAPGTTSAAGSARCFPLRPCQADDYEPVAKGPCLYNDTAGDWRREITFRLPPGRDMDLCAVGPGSAQPPKGKFESCDLCPWGSYHPRDPEAGAVASMPPNRCIACNSNEGMIVVNVAGSDAVDVHSSGSGCRMCYESSEVPARCLRINDFATLDPQNTVSNGVPADFQLPPGFSCPSCALGIQQDTGITVLFIGKKQGYSPATFTVDYVGELDGPIIFDYFLQRRQATGTNGSEQPTLSHVALDVAVYSVGNNQQQRALLYHNSFTMSPQRGVAGSTHVTKVIPHGKRQLVISLYDTEEENKPLDESIEFGLKSLSVWGAKDAPAESCVPCPAGWACVAGRTSPVQCAAGTSSSSGEVSCSSCALTQRVQPNAGGRSCNKCSSYLQPHSDAQACVLDKSGFFPPSNSAELFAIMVVLADSQPIAEPKQITRQVGDASAGAAVVGGGGPKAVFPMVNLNGLFSNESQQRITFPRTANRELEITLTLSQPISAATTGCLSSREKEYTGVSYGCATNGVGGSVSIGNEILRAVQRPGSENHIPGIVIEVGGLPCSSLDHPDMTSLKRSFTFEITCDAQVTGAPAVDPSPLSTSVCHTTVRARHAAACPLCMPGQHMGWQQFDCSATRKQRLKNYSWIDAEGNALDVAPCFPGYRLPPAEYSDCGLFDVHVTVFGVSVAGIVAGVLVASCLVTILCCYRRFKRMLDNAMKHGGRGEGFTEIGRGDEAESSSAVVVVGGGNQAAGTTTSASINNNNSNSDAEVLGVHRGEAPGARSAAAHRYDDDDVDVLDRREAVEMAEVATSPNKK